MDIVYEDNFFVNNSRVSVTLITDIGWEDIILFRAEAQLHEDATGVSGVVSPTYREIKDYLIKGE